MKMNLKMFEVTVYGEAWKPIDVTRVVAEDWTEAKQAAEVLMLMQKGKGIPCRGWRVENPVELEECVYDAALEGGPAC